MSVLDLRNAPRLFYGNAEARALHRGAPRVWAKPAPPISTWYGIGPGQVPMDHKYAEGAKTNGNLTAVPNLGGAGAMFNLTTIWTIPVTGQAAELDPTDYFGIAGQADLIGVRFFMVADIHSTSTNQYFGGQNESNAAGGKTNILLVAGGGVINISKNVGNNVAVQVFLSPAVSPGIRLYEIELISGGNLGVWVNGELRGSVANPHTSLLINRIAAGQSLSAGMNAGICRTLSLIQGGDYAARVQAIRARLNQEYGLRMAA